MTTAEGGLDAAVGLVRSVRRFDVGGAALVCLLGRQVSADIADVDLAGS